MEILPWDTSSCMHFQASKIKINGNSAMGYQLLYAFSGQQDQNQWKIL
jgi:hypothetical protein